MYNIDICKYISSIIIYMYIFGLYIVKFCIVFAITTSCLSWYTCKIYINIDFNSTNVSMHNVTMFKYFPLFILCYIYGVYIVYMFISFSVYMFILCYSYIVSATIKTCLSEYYIHVV